MLIFLSALLAVSPQPAPDRADSPPAPEIVVKGKPKMVCTAVRMTGSRVGRSKRCVTQEQAIQEAEASREAMRNAGSIQAVGEALACGPSTPKSCN